jgi:homoserine kinase
MRELSLVIPGSTSNLGAAFDTVGLALGIYSRMSFRLLDENDPSVPLISYSGAIAEHSSADATTNLTYRMLVRLWEDDKKLLQRIRIKIDSDIPLGCGLGSSAAAVAGALWAANFFRDRMPTQSELLNEAARMEGHSEMLAACLLGGFVVCAQGTNGKFMARSHAWPERWKLLFVVPTHRHDTAHARALLPKKVPYEDAVFNVQHSAMLISAVVSQDENALREALHDKLHEQYRTSYVPHFVELQKMLLREPALGCVLSGAGPSVLVIVDEKNKHAVHSLLKQWEESQSQRHTILDLACDTQGIRELSMV